MSLICNSPVAAGYTAGMDESAARFADVESLLQALRPVNPVYCLFPHVYTENAARFVAGFPGRVLYAVKANDHADVIKAVHRGGVRHFDCASLPEIQKVKSYCSDSTCYFMTPVRLRDAARVAYEDYGTRHFMVDHPSGVELLQREIDMDSSVVFARMAVSHDTAMIDLSNRFGAPPADIPGLLASIAAAGAEPALAFNVGSSVTSPAAYRHSLHVAAGVLRRLPFRVRLLDVGGGFPRAYPGFEVPPLEDYFDAIREDTTRLPLAADAEILGEPGRALAAPGMSAIAEVCLRKGERLFLNDGMYGIFWELRFRGHDRYPCRVFRDAAALIGETASFRLFGPTCDSFDELPGNVDLPCDIRPGDHIEFGCIGAYSLSGRTSFNGFHSDHIVTLTDGAPPGYI
jgi:ornithine decarboxylase